LGLLFSALEDLAQGRFIEDLRTDVAAAGAAESTLNAYTALQKSVAERLAAHDVGTVEGLRALVQAALQPAPLRGQVRVLTGTWLFLVGNHILPVGFLPGRPTRDALLSILEGRQQSRRLLICGAPPRPEVWDAVRDNKKILCLATAEALLM